MVLKQSIVILSQDQMYSKNDTARKSHFTIESNCFAKY